MTFMHRLLIVVAIAVPSVLTSVPVGACEDAESARDALTLVRAFESASWEEREAIVGELDAMPIADVVDAVRRAAEFPPVEPGVVRRQMIVAETGEQSEYILIVPPGYDPARAWPAWLALHPTGGTGGQAAQFMQEQAARLGFIAICPSELPERRGRGWAFTREERLLTIAALDDAKRQVHIDPDRVVIGGWSRGGHATYGVAGHHPALFCALHPVIGAPRANYVGLLRNLDAHHIRILNGAQDERLLVAAARSGVELLTKKVRADVHYDEVADRDHSVMLDRLPAVADACLAARRDVAADRCVVAGYPGSGLTEGLWLRIDAFERTAYSPGQSLRIPGFTRKVDRVDRLEAFHETVFAKTAWVEAKRNGNRFVLKTSHVRKVTLLLTLDAVDWNRKILVNCAGRRVFSEKVEPSVETLLDGYLRRRDTGRLFVAEIELELGRG